jgi:glycosyltransferase involved in cell wall biosynthesis
VVNLASSLVRGGWSATIACSVEGALASDAHSAGIDVVPLLSSIAKRRVSLEYAWRLANLARRGRFGLVHAHMFASSVAAAVATVLTHLPLIITEHSEATWRSGRARWYSRQAYRRATAVVAVSESIRRRLIVEDGVPAERVATIRNACATHVGYSAPIPPWLCSGSPAGPLIGVVARLQPEKGVQHFVEAASQVAAAVPEARFVVVGDGPLRDALAALATQLGVGERILFTGFRLDAPALVRYMDLLVVPSLNEGTPLVVLEAMSAGIPIVASAVGGIPEQVRHGREALLVSPADPRALACAMTRLLHQPELAHMLGRAAHQRALECFSPETLLSRTEDVYRAALRTPVRMTTEHLGFSRPSAR